jgi:hypothetical protein
VDGFAVDGFAVDGFVGHFDMQRDRALAAVFLQVDDVLEHV